MAQEVPVGLNQCHDFIQFEVIHAQLLRGRKAACNLSFKALPADLICGIVSVVIVMVILVFSEQ